MTKWFSRMLKRGQVFQRRNFQKTTEKDPKEYVCHKYGSPDHFIKFCPLWGLEHKRNNPEKRKETKNDK
ncbi:hypothetical protein R3W88_011701 [Solanum pinnatisectum]|uniref:Uncharacterized protein n=1 Tax=Solanum pinnatisectum TaxID=50273 RepID=A0AAV9L876_9SOLN|nr:hypothetical protein R3W88_011701 [Solanum pinnatisectum]